MYMVDMVHLCFHNVPLVQDDHGSMVVPMRKKCRTLVYSGEKQPQCTNGTSLYQLQCVQSHVHENTIQNYLNM